MSGAESHPQRPTGSAGHRPRDAHSSPQPDSQSGLLESVLEYTMVASEGDDSLGPEHRQAIEDVVQRYRGQPLVLEPVAQELVHAILSAEFRERPDWSSTWQAISPRIARTLWDDPIARSRLETLWGRLSGR